MTQVTAIETRYKGYRFRSRLEARWAVFFDAMEMSWEYEKEGYQLPSGPYLPDFWIPFHPDWAVFCVYPNQGKFVEIKGEVPTNHEVRLLHELEQATHHRSLFLVGTPGSHRIFWIDPSGQLKEEDPSWDLVVYLHQMMPSFGPSQRIGISAARGARFEHGERGI